MNLENPASATNALVGKTYSFRGKKIKNTNAAMIALERCGIALKDLETRTAEAAVLLAYSMEVGAAKTIEALSAETFHADALAFSDELSPEEFGAAVAIFQACISRFNDSICQYSSDGGESKNAVVA